MVLEAIHIGFIDPLRDLPHWKQGVAGHADPFEGSKVRGVRPACVRFPWGDKLHCFWQGQHRPRLYGASRCAGIRIPPLASNQPLSADRRNATTSFEYLYPGLREGKRKTCSTVWILYLLWSLKVKVLI